MTTLITANATEIPHSENVYMVYPREIAGDSLDTLEAGAYTLWVCAPVNSDTFVEVAGARHTIKSERAGERREEQTWRNLGQMQLPAGVPDMVCGTEISMVSLSKDPGFDPKQALAHVRVLPLPESVHDQRAVQERGTNTVFTMPHYASQTEWEAKAATLRNRILLGSGLYPMPEKAPLNARVFDEQQQDGYSVAKVHFEAWPGFLVTGNLYRPVGDGPFPGVINPHGHWENGRLEDSERGSVPARCITLARMGAVAFSYDMIGYVDSKQTAHNWGGNREKLWGIHTFAMQLWSSIRAVDFLCELPYVDPERIGCTGASGGGTQTFAVTAIDERIRVAAPVNMISSTMQGGCLCENAPVLRLDNSNMEIGALTAPRPMMMVSATGDWTRETPRVEYPAIKSIYALYGAAANVANTHLDYGHNYNKASREAVYPFFGTYLIGGEWDGYTEPDYALPEDAALRVFPGDEPPAGYLAGDALVEQLIAQATERRTARIPKNKQEASEWRAKHQPVFAQLLGVQTPDVNELNLTRYGMDELDGYVVEHWVIGRRGIGDQIPALLYRGPQNGAPQDAVILVHNRGKAFFADVEQNRPGALVAALLEQGKAALVIDAFLTGEHHAPDKPAEHTNVEKFHDTFQPTDTGHRVQDIVTAFAFLQARRDMTGMVDLVGVEEAGMWSLLAGAVEPGFRRVVADMNQFDITDDSAWENTYYIPGIRALGDVPTAIAAGGVDRFVLYNARDASELTPLGVYVTTTPNMPKI